MSPAISPRAQMDARIASATSAGNISSTDQKALSTALDSIDTSLSSTTGTAGGKDGMKGRIDSLIQGQVDSGALTGDQASELQSFFAQSAPADGGPGGAGKPHHGHGASAKQADATDVASTTTSTDGTDTASSSTSIEDQLKALQTMLETLRQGMTGATTGYGAATTTTPPPTGVVYQSVA